MTTVIKSGTKMGQRLIDKARNNEGENLDDVYGSYSKSKKDAMKDCKDECEAEKGENFRIISHNKNFFSVAWEFEFAGQEAIHIVTPSNSYIIV